MRQVQEALSGLGIPTYAGIWRPTKGQENPKDQYLVYSSTTTEEAYQDDQVAAYKTFVYLNLWSDIDPTDTALQVRKAMYSVGFSMLEESDKGYNRPAYDAPTRQFTIQWTWCLREEVLINDGD